MLIRLREPLAPSAPRNSGRGSTVLTLLVVAATLVLCLLHREKVGSALRACAEGDPGWMVLAALGAVSLWGAGTACQAGSLPVTPPLGRLFLVQIAASFASRFTPAGIGGMAVNLRFLRKQHIPVVVAVSALGLNAAAQTVAHVGLLVLVLLISPDAMEAMAPADPAVGPTVYATAIVLVLAALGAWVARGRITARWPGSTRRLRRTCADVRLVLVDPRRATALWGGALAAPLVNALVLYCAARSLHVDVGLDTVATTYLVVSVAAAVVPGPAGFGAFDVFLTAGLVAVGVDTDAAIAMTVAYRLLIVWLPLIPSGALLAVLVRRGVL